MNSTVSKELNRTYNVNKIKTKSFERRFSKRRIAIKKTKTITSSTMLSTTASTKYYGNNDLNFDLTNAMLILSPKLSSTIKNKKASSISPSSSTSSLSSLSSVCTNEIENRRCCDVNTINKNSATEILIEQAHAQPQQQVFSDDDGFCSDTQPKHQIGFKNQIRICRKNKQLNNINTIVTKNIHQEQQQFYNKCSCNSTTTTTTTTNNDLITTFNFNMASTPKSIRKASKKLNPTTTTTTATAEFDEYLNTKCTSCYHLSSTVNTATTTSLSSCYGCCCCCCCCGCSCNQQQQAQQQPPNTNQIYLARSTSGYKLVQVIDDKIMQRVSRRKLNHDIKSKYSKYYLKSLKNKLPVSLQPISSEKQLVPIIETATASTTQTYDVTCNQAIDCNAYFKKLIEKTKNLKSQSKKKISNILLNEQNNVNEKFDAIKKRKLNLFQRKIKKEELVKENLVENNVAQKLVGDNINDNKSFIQNTYLTDFNQLGQFRVWYV